MDLDNNKIVVGGNGEGLKDIDLTQEDFINVSDSNIDTLLDEEESEEDDYCNDENFEMTGF